MDTLHCTCHVCGEQWNLDVAPDPDLTGQPGYDSMYAGCLGMLRSVRPLCNRCAATMDLQAVRARLNQDFNSSVERGLLRHETRLATFAASNKEYETANADHWQTVRELALDSFGRTRGLYIYGGIGCGKTYMARCILNAVAERKGYGAACEMSARRYLHNVIQNDRSVWNVQHGYLLLLDDIDKATWKPETLQILWELFEERQSGVTIVTSNVSPQVMAKRMRDACGEKHSLADAWMDRLNPCVKIEMTGKSLRRNNAH